jgi:hypothetical protein
VVACLFLQAEQSTVAASSIPSEEWAASGQHSSDQCRVVLWRAEHHVSLFTKALTLWKARSCPSCPRTMRYLTSPNVPHR